MTVLVLSLLIGVVAGLRAVLAPAAVAWAAHLGWLKLAGTPLSFMGHAAAPWVLGGLALGELVGDKLSSTPSRKVPVQFGTRIVTGALCGAALAAPAGQLVPGALAGAIGAVLGTLGGAAARRRMAAVLGRDLPAALIEDAIAIAGALAIVGLAGASGAGR